MYISDFNILPYPIIKCKNKSERMGRICILKSVHAVETRKILLTNQEGYVILTFG